MNNTLKLIESQKVKEVILYILSQKGCISYYDLMKIMFCAERRNLIKWGDTITNLRYYAQKHGPVPLSVYFKIKQEKKGISTDYSQILSMEGEFEIKPVRAPNMDYLSDTDIESIDFAINELKDKNYRQIETYLHDEVYERVYATRSKRYTHADMALTTGASEQVLSLITENDKISSALS